MKHDAEEGNCTSVFDRFYSEEDDLIEEEKAGGSGCQVALNGCVTNSTSSNFGNLGMRFFFSPHHNHESSPSKCLPGKPKKEAEATFSTM